MVATGARERKQSGESNHRPNPLELACLLGDCQNTLSVSEPILPASVKSKWVAGGFRNDDELGDASVPSWAEGSPIHTAVRESRFTLSRTSSTGGLLTSGLFLSTVVVSLRSMVSIS